MVEYVDGGVTGDILGSWPGWEDYLHPLEGGS